MERGISVLLDIFPLIIHFLCGQINTPHSMYTNPHCPATVSQSVLTMSLFSCRYRPINSQSFLRNATPSDYLHFHHFCKQLNWNYSRLWLRIPFYVYIFICAKLSSVKLLYSGEKQHASLMANKIWKKFLALVDLWLLGGRDKQKLHRLCSTPPPPPPTPSQKPRRVN